MKREVKDVTFLFYICGVCAGDRRGGKGHDCELCPICRPYTDFLFPSYPAPAEGRKETTEMLTKLQKGDIVVTSSGIHGKISGVKDDTVTLEIADNVRIKLEKSAVQALKGSESPQ